MMNEEKDFTEGDWKLFRKKVILWQESYMDKLNQEYAVILAQGKQASEKFWELEKRIKKDRNKPGVMLDMRRSRLILNLLELLRDEVIKVEDLNDFSEKLKETIQAYISRW